jgi:hypothetical protein
MQSEIKNNSVCERCHAANKFICNPTNIAACACSKIELTPEEISYIAKRYSNCVCNTCLLHLKDEFLTQK